MSIKAAIFDIDGTLLTRKKILPQSAMEAIQKLMNNGIKVFLATGRTPFFTIPIANLLGIDSYVALNGSLVKQNGNIVFEKKLSLTEIQNILDTSHELNHRLILQTSDSMISPGPSIDSRLERFFKHYSDELPKELEFQYRNQDVYQIYMNCPRNEEIYYKLHEMNVDVIRYNNHDMDILPQNIHKAVGIEAMLKAHELTFDEVIAFGDGYNDIQMISNAGIGVAMGNGEEDLKKVANFVTKTVDEDGIYHGLKNFGLL